MGSDASLLTAKFQDGKLELEAAGSWTAARAGELEGLVDRVQTEAPQAKSVSIDMRQVREFDTFGAWLLERLTRQWGGAASIVGMPEHDRSLLQEMHGANREARPEPRPSYGITNALTALGRGAVGFGRDFTTFANMFGAIGVAAVRVVSRPRDFRLTSAVHQMDRVCWQAVPIILLITFLIGAIIAQQGIFHFRRFGAEDVCGRSRRHSHPARGRRAYRRHHGGGPFGQLLHRRARLDDDARGGGRGAPWASTRSRC